MDIIDRAKLFAETAHEGQMRKWSDQPFIEHPRRVAERVSKLKDSDENMVAAAWLHDTIEDCPNVKWSDIIKGFNEDVFIIVSGLTAPSQIYLEYTHLLRAERKAMDREHFASQPLRVRTIKAIDRIDNLSDSYNAPARFMVKKFLPESRLLADVLDVTEDLQSELYDVINEMEKHFNKK